MSKDHGFVDKTRSASDSSSKMKRSTWSPASLILNSLRVLQSGLNVRLVASTFRALLVRNLVASTYSLVVKFFDLDKLILAPSALFKESFFQSLRISFFEKEIEERKGWVETKV